MCNILQIHNKIKMNDTLILFTYFGIKKML